MTTVHLTAPTAGKKSKSKNSEAIDDTTKPTNLPAKATPTSGYVLTIDGKLKMRYETEEEAKAAGAALKQRFPVIQISVYDAATRVFNPLTVPEK